MSSGPRREINRLVGGAGLCVLLLALGAECRSGTPSDAETPRAIHESTAVAPIVDVGEGQLFGASRGDEWIPAERAEEYVVAGEQYRLIQWTDTLGTRAGSASRPARETCDNPTVQIDYRPQSPRDVIAVAGSWTVLPRVPRVQDTTQSVYKTAVAEHLHRHGIEIEVAAVSLDQVLRVDLDGEVRQRALEEDYFREACLGDCAPSTYRVAAVFDANGDGTMEVVTSTSYFEGRGKRVYAVDSGEPERVLSWRCGV